MSLRRALIAALLLSAALLFPSFAAPSAVLACETYVSGYYTANGTYVQPHYRTCANSTVDDNWSTRGNSNPHTGAPGYGAPSYSPPSYSSPSYSSPSSTRCSYYWNC
jgi:hypothetical protein